MTDAQHHKDIMELSKLTGDIIWSSNNPPGIKVIERENNYRNLIRRLSPGLGMMVGLLRGIDHRYIGLKKYNWIIEYLSSRWPDNRTWPADIPRPQQKVDKC